MFSLQKSALFMRQWQGYAQDYKNKAGVAVAEKFIAAVGDALHFIQHHATACALYDIGIEDLRKYNFRKWTINGFPFAIFFRITTPKNVYIEVLYAHKMDIPNRLLHDKEQVIE